MLMEAITDEAGLAQLAPEWQALAEACPTATVFQTYEWNSVWWQHSRRVPGRRLRVLTWRAQEGGPLLGLAPMMTGGWHGLPLRRLTFLGAGASDYHDLLALPGQEEAIVEAFYASLEGHIADLSQLRESGLLRQHLPNSHLELQYWDVISEACPFLPLPDDWDTLSRTFSKKMRSNISYYDRSLQKMFVVEVGYVTDADLLDAEMTRLFELHQRRWNQRWLPGVFGGRRVQAFHRDVAHILLSRDLLRLFTLKLDGETQAALYGFALGDRTCYYQAGFEPTLAKLSLGTVLIARALQISIAEGRTVFDFLRGDEPYKAKWTQQAHQNIRRLVVPAKKFTSIIAHALFQAELNSERRIKAWLRRGK
jgi:CelD/BcsL family acetyltransferase involved in cellulose biosynthesis